MTFQIYYLLYITLICCGSVKKTSKFFSAIIFIFLLIVFGLNNHHLDYSSYFNMDFSNYYTAYLSSDGVLSSRDMEIGFRYLMYFSNSIGLSINSFRLIIGVVGFSLIFSTIKRYSQYPNYVLSLYLIYPFINDVIQIRNFFAASIMIFSIRYLIESEKGSLLKFIVCILIASTIHISSLFYLIFIITRFINIKYIYKSVFVTFPFLVILAYTPLYPAIASKITDNQKVFHFLSRRTTFGLLLVFGVLFMLHIVHYILNKENRKILIKTDNIIINKVLKTNIDKSYFYSFMMKINIIMLLIAPLLVFDFNYIRLYRNILPLNFIVYIDAVVLNQYLKKSGKYKLLVYASLVLLFLIFYGFNASEQILPVFNDNILFVF